jgi:hypothetical protein
MSHPLLPVVRYNGGACGGREYSRGIRTSPEQVLSHVHQALHHRCIIVRGHVQRRVV